jgi:hypothetical protein
MCCAIEQILSPSVAALSPFTTCARTRPPRLWPITIGTISLKEQLLLTAPQRQFKSCKRNQTVLQCLSAYAHHRGVYIAAVHRLQDCLECILFDGCHEPGLIITLPVVHLGETKHRSASKWWVFNPVSLSDCGCERMAKNQYRSHENGRWLRSSVKTI